MILILNDGTQFVVNDESNIYQISMTIGMETIQEVIEKITTNNLNHATMGNYTFLNPMVNGFNISSPNFATGEVYIIVSLGVKSDIDIINERLDEQDAALMELAELIVG